MHGDPFAAGYVADDLFAANRVAAACPVDHHVVNALDHYSVLQAKSALDHLLERGPLFLLDLRRPVRWQKLGYYIARKHLAVADSCEQIIGAGDAVVAGDTVEVAV